MIVTANRTCVLLASEDIIHQRIDAHHAGAKRATASVGKHLGDGRSETPARLHVWLNFDLQNNTDDQEAKNLKNDMNGCVLQTQR
jgi:hypothetical protein